MQKVKSLLKQAKQIDRREAILLMAHVLKVSQARIIAHEDLIVDEAKAKRYLSLIARRAKKEPIAYLVGYQPFFGLEFKVNNNTLIPRPETETLVEKIISDMNREQKRKKNLIVVDIGTGSGCIACSIKKKFDDAKVIASDSSPATLSVVKYNANKLSTAIKVIHSNLFDTKLQKVIAKNISLEEDGVLFVVANLPYLPYSDLDAMQKDVVNYEPKFALFANDDGMDLIKKCVQQLKKFLTPYSTSKLSWNLYFEIDPRQVKKLKLYIKENFSEARVKFEKDLCGRYRYMILTRRA
jgi:release factor glutamine methyltransferase